MAQEAPKSLLQDLFDRRFFRLVGSYLAVSFGVLQFGQFVERRYDLEYMLVEKLLVFLLIMLPVFVIFIYNHGRPGEEKWLPYEKYMVPISGVAALFCAIFLFNSPLGATTEVVSITNEEGDTLTRIVPSIDYTKRLVILPFDNNTSNPDNDWLKVAGSYLLDKDLEQDMRIFSDQALSLKYYYTSYNQDYLSDIPFAIQLKIAQDYYSDYFVTGSIEEDPKGLKLTANIYSSDNGQEFYSGSFSGSDIFEIIDQFTSDISSQLYTEESGSSFKQIDLPVSNLVTQNLDALKKFIEGATLKVQDIQQLQTAIQLIEEAIQIDSQCSECYSTLSGLYYAIGNQQKARELISTATDFAEFLPERQQLDMRFYEYLFNDQVDRAVLLLENWRKLYPSDLNPFSNLIDLYERSFETSKAKEVALEAIANGHSGTMLTTLARLYTKTEEYDEAEKYLDQFAELYPHKAKERALLGNVYISKGELQKAKDLYEELLVLDPKSTDNLLKLGSLEENLGNFPIASQLYHEVLANTNQARDSLGVYDQIAGLFFRQGQYTKAFDLLKERELVFERFAPVPIVRQATLFQPIFFSNLLISGREEEYKRRLEEIYELMPDRKEIMSCVGEFLFDMVKEDLEGIESIGEECVAIIVQSSGDNFLHLMNAVKSRLKGDNEDAIEHYETYLETSGTSARQLGHELAGLYRKTGQIDQATELITKLLAEDPSQPVLLMEYAKILEEQNRPAEAKEQLNKALDIWKGADEGSRFFEEAKRLRSDWEPSQ